MRQAPDDDAPRLVWADAVGGERGEFVVLQCRLARDELSPAEAGALIRRHDELLAAHGRAWSGFADERAVQRCVFRRGFVEAIEVDVARLDLARMFERAPLVQSLHVRGIAQRVDYRDDAAPNGPEPVVALGALLEHPLLARLRGLELDDGHLHETWGDTEWDFAITSHGDAVLDLVASSRRLGHRRALALRDTFTPRGMQALVRSPVLAELEHLAFEFGEADRAQVGELLAAAPKLRSLALHHAIKLRDAADAIPPTVVELRASCETIDLEALAASAAAANLERLAITGTPPADFFAAFPRLRTLDVFSGVAASSVARTRLPALRELRPGHGTTPADALALADAFGSQLACFDLLGCDDVGPIEPIAARVAGYVRAGPWQNPDTLAVVGYNPREPWLRYGLVHVHR